MNDVVRPFRYPAKPHVHRHGPAGYSTLESFRPWLRDEFDFRCVYCLKREQWGLVRRIYDIDHFLPQATHSTVGHEYGNLLYSCATCNAAKRDVAAPNPSVCLIERHLTVDEDGSITGKTPDAVRLIRILGLDGPEYCEFRRLWIDIVVLAQKYNHALWTNLMKYPDRLPDLARLRPPENTRPEGIRQSCFARKQRAELPATY